MTIRDLLLARAGDDRPALLWDGGSLSWRAYVDAAQRLASVIEARLDPDRPPHVGVLLPNGPEIALHLAAAGLGGHVLVGLNTTRRGAALAADIAKADCQFVVDLDAHRELMNAEAPPGPTPAPTADSLFMLIFTSGTSGEPKAVRITHEKITVPGSYLTERLGLTGDDVHFCSMPMFHSNAVMAGWAPAVTSGASLAIATFSASGFLADVRRFGATYANYVGKPLAYVLATPEHPDDADNPLRLVFGNEAGDRDTAEFSRRFDCQVIDGFGSTENAVVVSRIPGTPPGSLGQPMPGVKVLDPEGNECAPGVVGELVNTTGTGQFAGYYNDEAATAERMRRGMYWSGDLAHADADGWIFYAGRTSDWLRVDGENLAAAPIERLLLRHPAISEAAVYAVPDPSSGDQLAAALVLRGALDAATFEAFLHDQDDLGSKSWPRHVLITDALPRTATNKVLKRDLPRKAFTWVREERGTGYSTAT